CAAELKHPRKESVRGVTPGFLYNVIVMHAPRPSRPGAPAFAPSPPSVQGYESTFLTVPVVTGDPRGVDRRGRPHSRVGPAAASDHQRSCDGAGHQRTAQRGTRLSRWIGTERVDQRRGPLYPPKCSDGHPRSACDPRRVSGAEEIHRRHGGRPSNARLHDDAGGRSTPRESEPPPPAAAPPRET